ncbi:MAG: hypothetical protein M3N32_01475, partial [Actinomycetota bacterium]|nr:hypothetical protein [Actinomycetota bacterium]
QVANNEVISLEGDTLEVGGEELDLGELGLTGQLAPLRELLESILNMVGLDIAQAKETELAAADGSHALARTEAVAISLSPLQGLAGQEVGGLNVALSMLPTQAEVRADNAAPAQAKPRAPAVQRPAPSKSLPRTGGGLAILGGLALGGAFALRRFTKS